MGKELAMDEPNDGTERPVYRSDADRFEALREQYFGNRVLPGSAVDLIREARESDASSSRMPSEGLAELTETGE